MSETLRQNPATVILNLQAGQAETINLLPRLKPIRLMKARNRTGGLVFWGIFHATATDNLGRLEVSEDIQQVPFFEPIFSLVFLSVASGEVQIEISSVSVTV